MLISIGTRTKAGDLVDLLLECHQRIRTFVKLAETVGRRDDVPATEVVDACELCRRYFIEALPLHVQDEEESLLPRLRGLGREIDDALLTMLQQHRTHDPLLSSLLASLRGVRDSPADDAQRMGLHAAAAGLAASFEPHSLLEERVIFPAIRSSLPAAAQSEIVAEVRARRQRPFPSSGYRAGGTIR